MADPLSVAALAFFAVIVVGSVLVGVNDWLEGRREEFVAQGRRGLARVRFSGRFVARASQGYRVGGFWAGRARVARTGADRCGDRRTIVSDWY